MSDIIENYINTICQQIRCKKVHRDISDEIKNHIDDQTKAFISNGNGMDEQSATIKAIKEMGDPVIVGVELDRIHRPKPEWSVIGLTIIMVLIGLATQFFITNNDFLIRRIVFTVIGIIILIIVYFIDYSIIGKYPRITYFIFFNLCLILGLYFKLKSLGEYPTYSYRILSALTLLFVPLFGGIVYSFRKKGYMGILLSGVFYLFPALVYLFIGFSLAVFVQITICCLIILTVAIIKDWFAAKKLNSLLLVFLPVLFTIIISIFSIGGSDYRIERIKVWLNPTEYAETSGYQVSMIKKVIHNSKFIGEAVVPEFKGAPIEGFVPEIETSALLTYLIGKLGFVFGLIIILFFALLVIRMFAVSFKQNNSLGFIISLASTLIITLQGILYILFNLGFGLYGNLYFVIDMFIIGLTLSAFRNENLIRDIKAKKVQPLKKEYLLEIYRFMKNILD